MKKVLLSILAVVAISISTQAQISIMPKFGVTMSNFSLSNAVEQALTDGDGSLKSRLGLTGGVALNIGLGEMFSIQPELNFVQKGTKISYSGIDVEGNMILNYIELPVLAKVSFGSETVKAYVNAGPSLGLGLNGKLKVEGETADIKFGDGDEDNVLYLDNNLDFGVQFGAGVGFGVGPGQLVIDARYGLGLSNLIDATDGATKDDVKSKNRVLSFSVGYMIPFGGK